MRLAELPQHQRHSAWIQSEIRFEEARGIHTYHDCPCGRGKCRGAHCAACWREALQELLKELEGK